MNLLPIYTGFILLVAAERILELFLSKRHMRWSLARGGFEHAPEHYPYMVALHTGFLVGCLLEVWVLQRWVAPWFFTVMLSLALLSQGLRWWVIGTLRERWNTRIVIVPHLPRVTRGPFRWMRHPNYVAVILEGFALPLMHGAWFTCVVFHLGNYFVLRERIKRENEVLKLLPST